MESDPKRDRSWTSIDLDSQYDGMCPYYERCGTALDVGKCRFDDVRFTFVGRVGAVDNSAIWHYPSGLGVV